MASEVEAVHGGLKAGRAGPAVREASSSARDKYDQLIAAAQKERTIKVAVAHPCDDVSLRGAMEAKRLGLIEPILVGPVERIRSVASQGDSTSTPWTSRHRSTVMTPPPRRSSSQRPERSRR